MKRENAVLILLVGICKMREREEKSEIKVKSSRIENKDFAKIIKKKSKDSLSFWREDFKK